MAQKKTEYTGKNPYKNSTSIENSTDDRVRAFGGFKQARTTDTEWLTKKNSVRQATDEPYRRFKVGQDA